MNTINVFTQYCNVAHLLFRNRCNKQCDECIELVKKRQLETEQLLKR